MLRLVLDVVPGTGRARERLARAADGVPLTARGALLGLVSAAALHWVGRGERDLIVLVLATSGLTAVALSAGIVWITGLRMRAALTRAQRTEGSRGLHGRSSTRVRLEVGRGSPSGLRLPAPRSAGLARVELRWVGGLQVDCELRRRRGRLEEWIRARRRFDVERVRRRIAVEDAFGLARIAFEHGAPERITAYPAAGAAAPSATELLATAAEGALPSRLPQGERFDLRRYQPGDPARHIAWRRFARTRELHVRVPERGAGPARRVAVYLVCGPQDEPSASAVRAALESGALGEDWRLGADGCSGEARRLNAALELLARSGNARGTSRIDDFVARGSAGRDEALVVFAAACAGSWIDEVERVARARGGATLFVLVQAVDARELDAVRARLAALGSIALVERRGRAA